MHDPLLNISQREDGDIKYLGVGPQSLDLRVTDRVSDGLINVLSRNIVVFGRDRQILASRIATSFSQAVKGLGTGDFVGQVQVDINQVRFAFDPTHDVRIPDLLGQCLPHEDLQSYLHLTI